MERRRELTINDKKTIDAYFNNKQNMTATAEALGKTKQAVSNILKKQEVQEAIEEERTKRAREAGTTNIELLTPDGLIKEVVRIYNLSPDPDLYKVDIAEHIEKYINQYDRMNRDDKAQAIASLVLKDFVADIDIQLRVARQKQSALKAIATYQKDFGETRDRDWDELMVMSTQELWERAKEKFKNIEKVFNGLSRK